MGRKSHTRAPLRRRSVNFRQHFWNLSRKTIPLIFGDLAFKPNVAVDRPYCWVFLTPWQTSVYLSANWHHIFGGKVKPNKINTVVYFILVYWRTETMCRIKRFLPVPLLLFYWWFFVRVECLDVAYSKKNLIGTSTSNSFSCTNFLASKFLKKCLILLICAR